MPQVEALADQVRYNCDISDARHADKLFLWDRMTYLPKSGRPALRFALERLGIADPQSAVLRQKRAKTAETPGCRGLEPGGGSPAD